MEQCELCAQGISEIDAMYTVIIDGERYSYACDECMESGDYDFSYIEDIATGEILVG